MATPRTVGRLPFQRMRPALPQLMLDCSALPTSPTVARQRASTLRISPEGIRSWAYGPSLATSWTPEPADRAILAPPPGRSSIAWITVPVGMLRSGRLLPGLMSAPAPLSTRSPWRSRAGATMYRFSPSAKCRSAMRAVRLGSYSMCATLAGTPSLSLRRKSIRRYWRLWPPPMWRVVMRPWLLRPPVFDSGRSSDFSGVERVISAKSATDEPRRPGVVGLYLRIAMFFLCSLADSREDVDRAGLEGDDRALGVLALAHAEPGAAGLALSVQRVDRRHLDVEDLLDRELDLGLVRTGVHGERVLALVDQAVALLGDDRRDDDVARVLVVCGAHAETSSFAALSAFAVFAATKASSAAVLKTMSSETSTS